MTIHHHEIGLLVLVQAGDAQVELEADQGQAEGDHRVLEELGPGPELQHRGGGRDQETLVARQAQHQGQHASHAAISENTSVYCAYHE